MKQKQLFFKIMAAWVMLLMGVNVGAINNNVELLANGTFTTNVTPAASILLSASGGVWYSGDNSKGTWNSPTGFVADAGTGAFITTTGALPEFPNDNFLGQITSDATINTGRYHLSINASGNQPFYIKISAATGVAPSGNLGAELTYVLRNASSASIEKQVSADYNGYSLKITPTGTAATYSADLDLQNGTPSAIRVFVIFPKVGSVTVDDFSLKRTKDIPTTYYIRPTVNTTAWTSTAGVDADQIISTTSLNSLNATYTYYFATGSYTLGAIASLTSGAKWYGGFSGNETSVDLNARATNDKDDNGIVEPWELTNEAVITTSLANASYIGTASTPRLMSLTGAEVNGLTFQDYNYSQDSGNGAIVLGSLTSTPSDAQNIPSNAGILKYCTIRKIKTTIGSGVIMMTNSASMVDKCLIEDCRVVAGSGGAIYMNRNGGIVSNSVLRNNIASGHGGAIYSGNVAVAGTYTGTSQAAYSAIVSNCAIYNNTGGTTSNTGGGAIRGEATSGTAKGLEIINCTVVNNTTGTAGNSSIELISSGVLANSIVLSDTKSEIRPNTTTNYVASTIYGANGGSALYPATNNVSGVADLTFTSLNFKTPTTFKGAVGNNTTDFANYTDALKSEIKAANYSITNSTSSAVTTTEATLPTSYLAAAGTGSSIAITATVPTTDITGLTRTGAKTLGAYQATHTVAAGETQTISQPTTLASLTVAAGGKLTINSGVAASIGTLTLESDATGTATMLNSGTFTGTVNAKQYLGSARNWYVSSPVSNATSPANSIDYYYEYVEAGNNNDFASQPGSSSLYWKGLANGSPMAVAKGYIAKANAGTTVQFSGTPNNGNITTVFDLTRDDAKGKGFNLVGNPYPSYIDWSVVSTANPNLSNTFYFRSKNTNPTSTYTFVTYNGLLNTSVSSNGTANTTTTRFIPPTQAFWVRVNEGTATTKMYFNNNMRSHLDASGNLLKAPKADNRTRLRLQLINGTEGDETLICTDANAENGFDVYDSPKMMNNSNITPDLYTKAGVERLVINGLNTITDNMELSLGFSLGAEASLKLKATEMSNFPVGTRIFLLDKEKNSQTELFANTEYDFSTTAATLNNESRFSIVFRAPGSITSTDNTVLESLSAIVNSQNKIVITAKPSSTYGIYNAIGQLIESGMLKSELYTVNSKLQSGIYVVKVNNASTKVIIK